MFSGPTPGPVTGNHVFCLDNLRLQSAMSRRLCCDSDWVCGGVPNQATIDLQVNGACLPGNVNISVLFEVRGEMELDST